MKKFLSLFMALAALALIASPALAAKPTDKGFDDAGYNRTARIFNGTGWSWCMDKVNNVDYCTNYLGDYRDDKIIMKWNEAWDNCNDAGDDSPESCLGAWTTNHWNGMKPGITNSVWQYKFIWVGPQMWDITGTYAMDTVYMGGHYGYTLTLDQSGNTLSGNLHDPFLPDGQQDLVVTGTITGNTFSFFVTYPTNYQGTRTFTGTISSAGTLSGGWTEDGTENGTDTWSTTSGEALLTEGPYWREGGYRIWGSYEAILDQGKDPNYGDGHFVFAHATPNGLGL